MRKIHVLLKIQAASLLAASALALGCEGAETNTNPDTQAHDFTKDGIFALKPGWNTIEPGGETICSRGTPYRYFVRPGAVNKVVIEFRGGGACWNDLTCGFADALFQQTADPDEWVVDDSQKKGIYDHTRADNPFKDWHHIYIPYCTGDIHWGNNLMTYGDPGKEFQIQHKGAVNAQAVLDWAFKNVSLPDQVMVTGCSAGAYGAAMWSAHVRKHYDKAKVYQLADSGAGVITDTFFKDSYPSWKPEGSYPTWIMGVKPEEVTRLPQLYDVIGKAYPDMVLSQYNTQYDDNQSFYFTAMGGGDVYEWSKQMNANVAEIDQKVPNFASFRAPDFKHCIIPYDDLYTVESDGVKLIDWIAEMVNDGQPDDVACEGAGCGTPKQ